MSTKKSSPPPAGMLPIAAEIRRRSIELWPDRAPTEIIGTSPALQQLLTKIEKFSRHSEPILILGESGCGKELIARACYLLSDRSTNQFVPVSCPQYADSGNTISELFGHKKGSFTGATGDRMGLFESADGGVIFLDEIADLPLQAQVMLLRTLAEGEYRRMGETHTRRVNTRVIAATHRPLNDLVVQKEFRHDLYFRLSYFPLTAPPLRERGRDWQLIANRLLEGLAQRTGRQKMLSDEARSFLDTYAWPGNVRQLQAAMTLGHSNADDAEIQLEDLQSALNWQSAEAFQSPPPALTPPTVAEPVAQAAPVAAPAPVPAPQPVPPPPPIYGMDEIAPHEEMDRHAATLYRRMVEERVSFWEVVREPFLDRDLNRSQVQSILVKGLRKSQGSYTQLLELFNIPADEYQKFMGFLRTHSLKLGVRTRSR